MFGLEIEAIGALVALLTSIYGLYRVGIQRGKMDGKIVSMERDIRDLEKKVDTSLKEVSDRITRMEERLFNSIISMSEAIRKDIREMENNRREKHN